MGDFNRSFCPICLITDENNYKGLEVSPPAVRCLTCGLGIEQRPILPVGQYKQATYDKARNKGDGGNRWARFHHDSAVAADRCVQLGIGKSKDHSHWVDVGCGNGAMLVHLRRLGWQVSGVEADEDTCRETSRQLGIPIISFELWTALSRTTGSSPVHVVSFIDSLEHMLDPVAAVVMAGKCIQGSGHIVIEVPDFDSCQEGGYATWKHRRSYLDRTEHLWQFSEKSLTLLFAKYLPNIEMTNKAIRPIEGRLQMVWTI